MMKYCYSCIDNQDCEALTKVLAYLSLVQKEIKLKQKIIDLPITTEAEARQLRIDIQNIQADYLDFRDGWKNKAIEKGCPNSERLA